MKKYKGLLLDIDNTLYPYDPCHKAGLESAFVKLKHTGITSSFSIFNHDYEKAKDLIKTRTSGQAASHNRILYFQCYLELHDAWNPENVTVLHEAYWKGFFEVMNLSGDAKEFLSNSSIPVVLITDLTAQIQHCKISRLGISSRIRALVTSEEAGVEKPDPRIFHLALKKINMMPEDVLYIGDDYAKDIQGARDAGIDAIWRNNFIKPDQIKNNIEEKSILPDFRGLHEIIG